jgi:hypothetical protein
MRGYLGIPPLGMDETRSAAGPALRRPNGGCEISA